MKAIINAELVMNDFLNFLKNHCIFSFRFLTSDSL